MRVILSVFVCLCLQLKPAVPPPPKVTPSKEMKAENIVGLFDAAAAAAPDISVTSPTEVSDQPPASRTVIDTVLLREEQESRWLTRLYCTRRSFPPVDSSQLYSTLPDSTLFYFPLIDFTRLDSTLPYSTPLYPTFYSTTVLLCCAPFIPLYPTLLYNRLHYPTLQYANRPILATLY